MRHYDSLGRAHVALRHAEGPYRVVNDPDKEPFEPVPHRPAGFTAVLRPADNPPMLTDPEPKPEPKPERSDDDDWPGWAADDN